MFRVRQFPLLVFVIAAVLGTILITECFLGISAAQASPPSVGDLAATTLTGTVQSANGRPMEGVTVSARDVDKTFTTSVFTDDKGHYFFPRLDQGQYRVWAQAVGFEAGRAELALEPAKERRQDFKLKATDDFTMQLSGAEWVAALPSDTPANRRLKEIFQHTCAACHTPSFVLQNRFDKASWLAILTSMERASAGGGIMSDLKEPLPIIHHFKDELAEYLARVRGPEPSPMQFRPLPRPTGEAARVVITEFDIPPAETPDQLSVMNGSNWSEGTPSVYLNKGTHDVTEDFFGNAWISASDANHNRTYAKIDTKTGKVTNFKVPAEDGFVRLSHEVTTGPDGTVWISFQGGGLKTGSLGKINPETEKLEIFNAPEGMTPIAPVGGHVDVDGKGKVWAVTKKGGIRFDPHTKQFTDFPSLSVDNPKFSTYGLAADSEGNGWWAILTEDKLGMSDIETGKSREVQYTPRMELKELMTEEDRQFYDRKDHLGPISNNTSAPWLRTPRRLAGDHSGLLMWSADFNGGDISSVDIRTRKVTYYDLPIPYASGYDVHVGNRHMVWVSLRNADRVGKFDPRTKKWTVYQLPTRGTECRNIYADEYGKTGNVWLASFRTSKAIRLQFRTEQQLEAAARVGRR